MTPSQLPVTLQLGKDGATEAFLAELREQVRRRKVVKVRLLKTAREAGSRRALADGIAQTLGIRVVDVRGHVAVFADLTWSAKGGQPTKKDPGMVK